MKSIKKWNACQRGLFLIFVLGLLTMAVGPAGAAKSSGSSGRDNPFVGTWEGTFETNEFPGHMMLSYWCFPSVNQVSVQIEFRAG